MKYIDLLGQSLKGDDVIDILECDDLDVIYAFDRLRENQPDEYWVASKAAGVQMRFNEHQILDLLFSTPNLMRGSPGAIRILLEFPFSDHATRHGNKLKQTGRNSGPERPTSLEPTVSGLRLILDRISITLSFAGLVFTGSP